MGMKPCICEVGDPCDYHAATCVVCPGGCKGHPEVDPAREAQEKEVEALRVLEEDKASYGLG